MWRELGRGQSCPFREGHRFQTQRLQRPALHERAR